MYSTTFQIVACCTDGLTEISFRTRVQVLWSSLRVVVYIVFTFSFAAPDPSEDAVEIVATLSEIHSRLALISAPSLRDLTTLRPISDGVEAMYKET